MRKLLLAMTALLSFGVVAQAADLRLPTKAAPLVAPTFSWSGLYLEGYVGYGANIAQTLSTLATTTVIDTGAIPRGPGVGGGIEVMEQLTNSPWVIGAKANIGYLNLQNTANITSGGLTVLSLSNSTNYIGSADVELGYAINRFLLTAGGGFGYGGAHPNLIAAGLCIQGTNCSQAISDTSVGWHIFGEARYAVSDSVSVFIRGDYYDLGSKSLSIIPVGGTVPVATSTAKYNIPIQTAGLVFKLF